jgi:curved DNA-binding protein CbpA
MIDYYEFLQISPHADTETIHRVYRFLAARLHPDNPVSGNSEMFRLLKSAYDVLSDPAERSEYDAARSREPQQTDPLSTSIDFMDNLEGELNRRVAVLAVLYFRRRTNPHAPEVPLADIERRMGFPRDYLDFTTWYLVRKGLVVRADNSDFTLTAEGVDYVETQRANLPVLNKLLTDGKGRLRKNPAVNGYSTVSSTRESKLDAPHWADRRKNTGDRRSRETDHFRNGNERRTNSPDRRVRIADRRMNSRDRRAYL